MPLINQTAIIDADIRSTIERLAGFLAASASMLNAVANTLLEQSDEALAEWLNGKSDALEALLSWHATTGQRTNVSIEATNLLLSAAGLPAITTTVDVTPFSEKLAVRNRVLSIDASGFHVTSTPPPQPETTEP